MDEDQEYQKLCWAAMQFLVSVGLMRSVMPKFPEHVRENFSARLERMTEVLTIEALELQEFGEAYDEESHD